MILGPNLAHYVKHMNARRSFFKSPALDLTRKADRDALEGSIDCDMSPENLHQDGEASASVVARKRSYFNAVLAELNALSREVSKAAA